MGNIETDFKVIIAHKDLKVKEGIHNDPRLIGTEEFDFVIREEAVAKFIESINYYKSIAYDDKAHSNSEFKFYHSTEDTDILTYIFLYHNGEPYNDLTDDELGSL